MMHVHVIGAGLAGPSAALSLAHMGHSVEVFERRSQVDVWSDQTIAITTANIEALSRLGIPDIVRTSPGAPAMGGMVRSDTHLILHPEYWTTKFNIVVWGTLHAALVRAAKANGATFNWRVNDAPNHPADLVVHAQGVVYAAHHSDFTYAYSVARGTRFGNHLEHAWTAIHDEQKRFSLAIGQVEDRATFMFYWHRPEPKRLSTITDRLRPDGPIWELAGNLPTQYREFIRGLQSPVLISPVGDWTMPRLTWWTGDHDLHVDIGDAIAPVRPHTTAGANLGITEALQLGRFIESSTDHALEAWDFNNRQARQSEILNGKLLGTKYMGV